MEDIEPMDAEDTLPVSDLDTESQNDTKGFMPSLNISDFITVDKMFIFFFILPSGNCPNVSSNDDDGKCSSSSHDDDDYSSSDDDGDVIWREVNVYLLFAQ